MNEAYFEVRVVSAMLGVVALAEEHVPQTKLLSSLLELFDHWDDCLPSSAVLGQLELSEFAGWPNFVLNGL